jgi:hypothetical protein
VSYSWLWRNGTGDISCPPDPAGVEYIGPVLPTPDGKAYAYGYRRLLSDPYLVEGLK